MKSVLIVDDEEMIKQFLREELEDEGYRIILASSGKEALSILNQPEKPDVVILDLRMHDMNGIEMMGFFLKAKHDIPVIVFTAYGAYRNEPLLMAADAYVIKSSDTTELKKKVRELAYPG